MTDRLQTRCKISVLGLTFPLWTAAIVVCLLIFAVIRIIS